MNLTFPVIAGIISSSIFALSMLPMLAKAFSTRELKSYSLSNLILTNIGNLIHSLYVFSLPPGPIWLLHIFYLISTGLMLLWYLRYEGHRARPSGPAAAQVRPEAERAMAAAGRSSRDAYALSSHLAISGNCAILLATTIRPHRRIR